ncbi:MAG: MBL fold metallo-hydrolase [Candidatus Binataceae bacterium]
MNLEIEFRPVGEGSKAGDCLVIRHGTPQEYWVTVVDGGTRDSGAALVDHLRALCGKDVKVADVIVTHADQDHASGIRDVLEGLKVYNLWMHVPWLHAAEARPYFKDKRFTDAGLADKLRKEYDILNELFDLASARNVVVREPFRDAIIGPFRVLSPTSYSYVRLLPQFSRTPDAADEAALIAENYLLEKPKQAGVWNLLSEKVKSWVDEKWDFELLQDKGVTSASNESSTVLYGDFGEKGKVLLTGDAGPLALKWSAEYADNSGLQLQSFEFVQVPHHGSRSNVGPTLLNRIIGPTRPLAERKTIAYISAPKDDDTHPRKMVVNAFNRRCKQVFATQGNSLIFPRGFQRTGLKDATPLPFYARVENYE